jgi:hypothetical protein
MITLNDIETIEGLDDEATMEDYYLAMQRTINSGMWGLQGSYGRAMMDAISAGLCMLGRDQARDYYGNTIPSRDDVQAGTKGSYQFVVDERGQEWADLMLEA